MTAFLFADDKATLSASGDSHTKSLDQLSDLASKNDPPVSASKTDILAMKLKEMIKIRNAVNNNIDIKLLNISYLSCQLSINRNSDMQNKLQRFNNMCGTIKRTVFHKSRQETILKFCKLLAV